MKGLPDDVKPGYLMRKYRFRATIYALQIAFKWAIHIAVLVYALLSFNRNYIWKDDYSIWKDTAEKSQYKARPHSNFALAAYRKRLFDEALTEAQKTLKFYYYHPDAHNVIGLVAYREGRYDEAIRSYRWALLTTQKYLNNPKYEAEIHNSLGLAYKAKGYYYLARTEFEKALMLNPFLQKAKINLETLLEP
jgi:tetratricopeptide (TPR) repeat protein